ncbi:DUF4190 domain-containing protein [Kitasatospora purpeofusca]|uniref:DUF4190 domain-containing protein n=1 Tax=Kitasatospora purpeofusca TaxID=67352 RepID=A0ABZ1TS48_9ACTN|nr:DUF4190 domain-containing protein [Kitasatospora purpeofusca]
MNIQETETPLRHTAFARADRPRKNGSAGAAVVLGVIGLSTSIVLVGGLLGVVGLAVGIVALVTAGRTGEGRGRAITGVVTSALAIVVSVLATVLLVWYADNTRDCYQPDSLQQYRQCVQQQLSRN